MSEKASGLPRIARYKPYYQALEKGRTYRWCSCGLSSRQPFCDGSHRGTGYEPVSYTAREQGEEVLFCGCKHSAAQPFCDGAHNNLKGEYESDDPNSAANRAVRLVSADKDGRAWLNGGCYVQSPASGGASTRGNLSVSSLINADSGARFQSQFYFEAGGGTSPVVGFGRRDVALLVAAGSGRIEISGRRFAIEPETGVYIRPGEAFHIDNPGGGAIQVFASVCPLAHSPEWPALMPENFDARFPERVVGIDRENRQAMGNRFFQILVDSAVGSDVVTQFIGEIPLSKALPHRHLYEESLVILRGSGYMWTQDLKAKVSAGDIVFLPRKQQHSLECTDAGGLYLVGVIYPGNNPAVNY